MSELRVDSCERVELGLDHVVVALSELVQVEDQAAKVAVGKLACRAQEPGATSHAAALEETWLWGGLRRRALVGWRHRRRAIGSGVALRLSASVRLRLLWRRVAFDVPDVPVSSEDPQH